MSEQIRNSSSDVFTEQLDDPLEKIANPIFKQSTDTNEETDDLSHNTNQDIIVDNFDLGGDTFHSQIFEDLDTPESFPDPYSGPFVASETDTRQMYPGSTVTLHECMSVLLYLVLQLGLSNSGIDMLMKTLACLLPVGSEVPKTGYFFFKYFSSIVGMKKDHYCRVANYSQVLLAARSVR